MKIGFTKNIFRNLFIFSWAIIIISLFIAFPGRFNFIIFASLADWQLFIEKLYQLNIWNLLTNTSSAFFGILFFVGACLSIGTFILRDLIPQKWKSTSNILTIFANIATAILLGQLVLSFFFQGLARHSLLNIKIVFIILSACYLLGFRFIKELLPSDFRLKINNEFHFTEVKDRILLWLSISIVFLSIFLTTTRLGYDAVSNYFVDAKLTALLGEIDFARIRQFPVSQIQTGVLFSSLILTFGDQAARMLSWFSGLIVIVFSLALGEKLGLTRKAKLILLVFLASTTSIVDLMGDGKVDLISLAFIMSALYWLNVEYQTSSRFAQILIGIMAGFSMLLRPFNIPLVGAFIGMFYLWRLCDLHKDPKSSLVSILQSLIPIGTGIIILGLYYLFNNWEISGDPLAFMKASQNITAQNWQWAIDKEYILIIRLFYPIIVSLFNSAQMLGNITPLFLAFGPILLIKENRQTLKNLHLLKIWGAISVFILIGWIWCLFTIFEIRYVHFLWISFYIVFSVILSNYSSRKENHNFKNLSFLLMIILLIFSIYRILFFSILANTPYQTRNHPVCSEIPFCEIVHEANQIANSGDRILTLNAYIYYLKPDLLSCSTTSDEYTQLQELSQRNPNLFWEEVYRQGYEYIIYENNFSQRHLLLGMIPSNENTPSWMTLETIFSSQTETEFVYRIITDGPPLIEQKRCKISSSGAWVISN